MELSLKTLPGLYNRLKNKLIKLNGTQSPVRHSMNGYSKIHSMSNQKGKLVPLSGRVQNTCRDRALTFMAKFIALADGSSLAPRLQFLRLQSFNKALVENGNNFERNGGQTPRVIF